MAKCTPTLHGDLGTILEWAENGTGKKATDTPQSGMFVSVVVGERNHSTSVIRLRLQARVRVLYLFAGRARNSALTKQPYHRMPVKS